MDDLLFPQGFLWGTATSSHQVEGGNLNSDWWDWEQAPGHICDGSSSRLACDHFHRYRSDWALARDLGQNAHRLSIEWSRIQPEEGVWDDDAIDHYRDVLAALCDAGLVPLVTLHHFTNPRWFVAKGGWENRAAVRLFTTYVTRVVSALSEYCNLWVTINEPMVYFYEGYLTKRWPPGRGSIRRGLAAVGNMIRAHGRSYSFIHTMQPDASVGIAHNMRLFDPLRAQSRLDRLAAGAESRTFNWVLLWALIDGRLRAPLGRGELVPEAANSLDFIGLNYYTRDMVSFALRGATAFIARNEPRLDAEHDRFGWEVYPEGILRLLRELATLGKPLYVTESGIAESGDTLRPAYIVRSAQAMWQAIQEGIPLRGYFHWSLLDNFEWAEGYSVPFGLVAVDPDTQQRRVKQSGRVYQRICQANGVPTDLAGQYTPAASAG
jgi:beta-glucosidase